MLHSAPDIDLQLTRPPQIDWDWPAHLIADLKAGKEPAEISITVGNQQKTAADLFDCQYQGHCSSEENSAERICLVRLSGDLSRLQGVGRLWQNDQLEVIGDTGNYVGAEMQSGQILVQGNVGAGAGCGMQGGSLQIRGNAGQYVGGPAAGSSKGMTGGEIFIDGTAGTGLGERMRRGTICVSGSVAGTVASEMLAGTIVLHQRPESFAGLGMKRGTVIVLESNPGDRWTPGPQFDFSVEYSPVFLRVLWKHLQQKYQWKLPAGIFDARFHRYCGDMLEGGRGEILVLSS